MPDIGDDVTISTTIRVDGALTNPTAVAVTVTSPAGTVTTPADTNPSIGYFEAVVPAVAEAGRWLYNWVTTGPAGEDFGYFDVDPDPPRLMPLATIADLEERVDSLTDAQKTRAPALLRDASAKIRGYTKRTFDKTLNATSVLRPVGAELRLPQTPVMAVDQVEQIGTAGTADRIMGVSEWAFDGIDRITLWPDPYYSPPIAGTGTYSNTYRVRYDHSYTTTPDDVLAVCCDMVLRTLNSPTTTEGLVQERIGQYSYQYGQFPGGQSTGSKVRLTDEDRKELKHYRRSASTVQLRV